ncbi:TetR/AcrR family transcriptional regulator [Actinomadura hibisca]|uniref:TetR/AcrR family transcriptional regulator n=1 Tax=Actinomadura hibisca TaxID=68565 RepID=UPI000836ACA4|nr:TetR/AcrR family transcriptional regulator [Actinomadura hibisca]
MSRASSTDERVRAAAVALFAAKGFHGTGIRELADAAGLSSATLYHYMGTKEDLLVELMRTSLDRLVRAARQIVDEAPSPVAALNGLVQTHVVTHALRQAETLVVDTELRSLSPEHRSPIVAQRDEYEHLWRSVLEEGRVSGAFHLTNPSVARLALLQMCSGVSNWYSSQGAYGLTQIAQEHARMSLTMLGAEPGLDLPTTDHYIRLVAGIWGHQSGLD